MIYLIQNGFFPLKIRFTYHRGVLSCEAVRGSIAHSHLALALRLVKSSQLRRVSAGLEGAKVLRSVGFLIAATGDGRISTGAVAKDCEGRLASARSGQQVRRHCCY